jgi:murein lipoprotein
VRACRVTIYPIQEFIAEDSMKITHGKALPIIAVAGTLALGACASQGDVDDLRKDVNQLKSDVAKLQSDVTAARTESARAAQQAQAAATEARNAAAAANAAAERADRMFQKGLRK